MSNPFPPSLPPGPAQDGTPALIPVSQAPSSLAVRPEVALAVVTETLTLATNAMDAKWERKREALFHRHVALQEAHPQELDKISRGVDAVFRTTTGFCVECGATVTSGALCSQRCASKAAEAANARMAKVQAELDETIDRESAALAGAVRAEIHEGELQALQRLDRATLKTALTGCYEEYRAAWEQCNANDRHDLKLRETRVLLILSERSRRVLRAQRTARRIEEALDRVLQRERDERVRHTGTPQRHCQVCLVPVIEESPWCSRQCEDAARARKHYEPRFVPGLFRCAWCRMYFWVPDPDAAAIDDMAPFCSRACLEASVVDLAEHADMNFSTVKKIAPPPPTIAGRQRAIAAYLRRFVEDQGRRQSRHNAALTPSPSIEITASSEAAGVPDDPDPVAMLRGLLAIPAQD